MILKKREWYLSDENDFIRWEWFYKMRMILSDENDFMKREWFYELKIISWNENDFADKKDYIPPSRIIVGVFNNLMASVTTLLSVCEQYQFDFCAPSMCIKSEQKMYLYLHLHLYLLLVCEQYITNISWLLLSINLHQKRTKMYLCLLLVCEQHIPNQKWTKMYLYLLLVCEQYIPNVDVCFCCCFC